MLAGESDEFEALLVLDDEFCVLGCSCVCVVLLDTVAAVDEGLLVIAIYVPAPTIAVTARAPTIIGVSLLDDCMSIIKQGEAENLLSKREDYF